MPSPKKSPTLPQEIKQLQRERIDQALAEGCDSARQIAARLGISSSATWRLMKELGYQQLPSGWTRKGGGGNAACPPKNGKA